MICSNFKWAEIFAVDWSTIYQSLSDSVYSELSSFVEILENSKKSNTQALKETAENNRNTISAMWKVQITHFTHTKNLKRQESRGSSCSGNTVDLYSGGASFEFRPWHRLNWLSLSWFFWVATGKFCISTSIKPR